MKAGHNVFPSYFSLRKSKQACHPAEEHIAITETRAEINLQALLNKTVERLILAQNEVISSVLPTSSSFTFNLVNGDVMEVLGTAHTNRDLKTLKIRTSFFLYFLWFPLSYMMGPKLFGKILGLHQQCIVAQSNLYLLKKRTTSR